ncbi:hypothetical protein [Ekhidna sp.]
MNSLFLKAFTICLGFLVVNIASSQPNKPVETFEACWNLFNDSYASFEEKNIDWDKTYDEFRPQVTSTTTDKELFIVLTNMLKPLGDAHVNLIASNIDTAFSADRHSSVLDILRSWKGESDHILKL